MTASPLAGDDTNTLERAREYVARGFSVIPLQPRGKKPVVAWKEFQSRRPTDEELVAWFSTPESRNIGIVTGAISGITVIDTDSRDAIDLATKLGIPTCPVVSTSKGLHFYCAYEQGVGNFQKRDDLPGIDLRGDGGYVVGPPSIHESGAAYNWEGESRKLPKLPRWILSSSSQTSAQVVKMPIARLFEGATEGSRNDSLARLVGSVAAQSTPIEVALQLALIWGAHRCLPAMDPREIERTVRSIYAREFAKRRAEDEVEGGWVHEYGQSDASRLPDFPDSRSLKNTGTGMSVVRAWEEAEPEPMPYLIEGLIHRGHSAGIFGDGGSGKSLLSIYLGCCVATGEQFFGRDVQRGNVLFLDWELELSEHIRRAYRVARGMGLERIPEGVHYAQLSLPITDPKVLAECRAAVADTQASLVIIDSFAPASCASDQVAPSEIVPFMQRLRELGTVLLLDHVAKPIAAVAAPPLRAYGSTFKHNLVRSSLRLDRGDAGGVRLAHVKNNFGPLSSPIAFAMVHGFDTVRFERIDANDARLAGLNERARSVPERILEELAQFGEDGASASRLAELLGCSSKTISNHLTTLRAQRRIEQAAFGAWRVADFPGAIGKVSGSGKVLR